MVDRIRRLLIGDSARFLWLVWFVITIAVGAWVASQFASDSPCRFNETTSACHGRRVAEGNPVALVVIVLAWVVLAFVIPGILLRRRN